MLKTAPIFMQPEAARAYAFSRWNTSIPRSQSAFAKSSPQRSNTKTTLAMDAIQNQGRFVFGVERPGSLWVIGQKVCLGASTSYWDKGLLSGTLTRRFLAPIPSVHLHP